MRDIQLKDTILAIRKHPWKMGAILFLVAVVLVWYFMKLPFDYKSTAIFFVKSSSLTDHQNLFLEASAAKNIVSNQDDNFRAVNIAFSTEVIDHIISKFNLYEHYHIDSIGSDSHDMVTHQYKSKFLVEEDFFKGIRITFSDNDRYLAARILNEVIAKTEEINRRMLVEGRRKVLDYYESYHNDVNNKLEKITQDYIQIKSNYKKLSPTDNIISDIFLQHKKNQYSLQYTKAKLGAIEDNKEISDTMLIRLKTEVEGLSAQYSATTKDSAKYFANLSSMINYENLSSRISQANTTFFNELYLTEKLRQRVSEAISVENQSPTIQVIQKAIPDLANNWVYRFYLGIFIFLFAALLLVIIFSYWEVNKETLKLLFSQQIH